jgi:hypothetical protein
VRSLETACVQQRCLVRVVELDFCGGGGVSVGRGATAPGVETASTGVVLPPLLPGLLDLYGCCNKCGGGQTEGTR